MKVFTVRHFSDIKGSDIIKGYSFHNFHGYPVAVFVRIIPPFVFWYNWKMVLSEYTDLSLSLGKEDVS